MDNKLENIHLDGFKSIKSESIEIKDLNILIGANGSGKSNFIAVFRLLRQIVERRLRTTVREEGGAERMLYYGSKVTNLIEIQLDFPPNYYSIRLKPTNNDDNLFVEEESTGYKGSGYSTPFWKKIANGETESKLKDISQSGVAKYVFETLKSWRVYHFHDTSERAGVRKTGQINENLYLREDASNLAAFLHRMQQGHPQHFKRIEKTIQLVVPMFQEFLLRPVPENPDTIRLEWFSNQSDYVFTASELSDGSLRFICLCALLLQPKRPGLILLDEPELGLHPAAIQVLGGLIQKTAHFSQLIVSTQSADLVSCFKPEDILVVEHRDGATVFDRPDEERLKTWLSDYTLGELWEKNIIGGRP